MTVATDELVYAGEIVIVSCWCGIRCGLPAELDRFRRRKADDGSAFAVYCPLGHAFVPSGKSKAERLQERLDSASRSEEFYRQQAAVERRRAAAARGQLTKLRNRVARGMCPDATCKRSFTNIADHVRHEHPELLHLVDGAE